MLKKILNKTFYISLVAAISTLAALNQLYEFRNTRIPTDFLRFYPIRSTLLGESSSLPAGYRAASFWFLEIILKLQNGTSNLQEQYPLLIQTAFVIIIFLLFMAIPLFFGYTNKWSFLAMFSIFYVIRWHDLEQERFTDFPAILFSTIVFGLMSIYYFNQIKGARKSDKIILIGLFVFAFLGSFVRESILMAWIFFTAIFVFEAMKKIGSNKALWLHNLKVEISKRGTLYGLLMGSFIILMGILVGKILLYITFPELNNLHWQRSFANSQFVGYLPGFANKGNLITDMLRYLPGNIYRTPLIFLQIIKQYVFVFIGLIYLFKYSNFEKSRMIAFSISLTLFLHFLFYYLFGGIYGEGYGIMSLVVGVNIPLIYCLRQSLQ